MQDDSRALFEAAVARLRDHPGGVSFPVAVNRTFEIPVGDIDGKPRELKFAVTAETKVRLFSATDAESIGIVDCRDNGTGNSLDVEYILVGDLTPRLYRRRAGSRPGERPADPVGMANHIADNAVAQLAEFLPTIAERTEKALSEAAARFVEARIIQEMSHSALVVGEASASSYPVSLADVPFYRISKDGQGARCDVVDVRETLPDDWKAGLSFEPWEAKIAYDVARAYGALGYAPRVLEAFAEHASDLAIVMRMEMNCHVRLFIKSAMLDVAAFKHSEAADRAASIVFQCVNENDWGSPDLDHSLAVLDEIWFRDKRMWEFTESRGWDAPTSPFAVMAERVASFPWRQATPSSSMPASVSPSP